ncbi:F-box protein [Acorus calamus]|uniref:F-box protein n=1 Tax=Acorus calamus TaxID=4465 RepID=A0AAV9CT75_ACOCL|nr:F-box protein [Acorus calamus]
MVSQTPNLVKPENMQSKTKIHIDPLPYPDRFDGIPDSLVLLIFNKLADVRSLGRCSVVSKRFNSLVPLVHDVFVKIDRVVTVDGDMDSEDDPLSVSSTKPRNLFSHLIKLVLFTLLKPFNQLRNTTNGPNKALLPQLSHHSPAQVLKNFTNVRDLRIELPAGDLGTEDGVILKWKAEFGSTLQNCVILGGTCVDRKPISDVEQPMEDNGSIPEPFYTNGGLKLRVVWTISSLIAASTRHYLLRQIIKDHPTLRNLVFTDADGQGTLCMGCKQLKEFREKPLAASASSNRTQVPASNMKLRYAPYLELAEGVSLQGATLVSIKPSVEGAGHGGSTSGNSSHSRKEVEAFAYGAFDGPSKAAVKALVKQRTYLLEMNGF